MSGESPAERREAAATRRRWVTLAEVVAVAGVLIAALTLWSNWSDRRADQVARAAQEARAARADTVFEVRAVPDKARKALMLLRDERHALGDVTVVFPTALGVASQSPVPLQTIERDWFADALLKATAGGPDTQSGRLPILLTVAYSGGDRQRIARGIYDIVWTTEGRFLRGRALHLEALRLRRQGGDQAALDAAWARERPVQPVKAGT
jgi:hypothetical protein